ncbi:hypothetical protein DSM106972_067380 [Dulcicalothrix desertica PCC 7102]|uniref:Uncharacterized protein n=1 Tax=Dulcicalothrix desertica PCC 7102 TaxID=232991 RepID=A0A3S1AIL1_9CYAN|nr:hypothetical protein [Dulcicalothrix desertica]RUT01641.1 hypothetical protein DSM106972_067380 [Dulcicalothrix desertica PCC 7102]TWH43841.1 hypothetical protein CAL7102_07585 [Dulcicalothrix desertica PCC 7102]
MQLLQLDSNQEVFSVLSRYPEWLQIVLETIDKAPIDGDYYPHIIEVFDQHGLLAGKVQGKFAYECTRTVEEKSDFTAWFIDGELMVFYVGSEVLINRFKLLTSVLGGLL